VARLRSVRGLLLLGALALLLAREILIGPGLAALRDGEISDWSLRSLRRHGSGSQPSQPEAWQRHQWVDYECMSGDLLAAVVAGEDAGFTRHSGFSWRELRVALQDAWSAGRLSRGASTISQQLVKNLFLSPERSLGRKLHEALLTVELEAYLDKRRILEIYLNIVEWGEGVYGAQAAARHYFDSDAASLTAEQAAFLAARLPAPLRKLSAQAPDAALLRRIRRVQAQAPRVSLPAPRPGVAAQCVEGPPRPRTRAGHRRSFLPERLKLHAHFPSLVGYPRVTGALGWGLRYAQHAEILRGLALSLRAPVRRHYADGASDARPAFAPLDATERDPPIEQLSAEGALLEAARMLVRPDMSPQHLFGPADAGAPLDALGRRLERDGAARVVPLDTPRSLAVLERPLQPWLCTVSHQLGDGIRVHHHALWLHPARRPATFFVFDATPVAGLGYSKLAAPRLLRYLDRHLVSQDPRALSPGSGRLSCVTALQVATW